METQPGTLHSIARHLVLALEPLKEAVADLPSFRTFLYRLGWDVRSLPPEYTALAAKVDAALTALDGLGDDPKPNEIHEVLGKVKALYKALKEMSTAPEGVDPAEFSSEIGERLFELLLVDYLTEALPGLYSALLALDIITQESVNETPTRPGFLLNRFQWEEIPNVLTDPASIATRVYGWGTDDVDFHRLTGHLLGFFLALDWPAYIGRVDEKLGLGFQDEPDVFGISTEWELKVPMLLDNIGGKEIEVGLALLELPAQGGKHAGLILQPLMPPEIGTSYNITDHLRLELRPGSDVTTTLGVLLRPGDISVKFPLQEGTKLPEAGFGVKLRYALEGPALLLGAPGKTRLELKGLATNFNLDSRDGKFELQLEAAPEDLKLTIAAADLDGFLGEVVRNQDISVPLPLTVRWSSKTGIGFVGGAGFQVRLPVNLHLGLITLQQLQLGLSATHTPGHAPDLILDAGASLGGQLGPVAFSADNVGLRLVSRFTDGNAGPFDIDLGFRPPNAIGIAVEAPGVTGGGFLFFDPDQGQYAGSLGLLLRSRFELNVAGLLTTRMPDGTDGYSLLLVGALRFPAIPVGFGFSLNKLGALVGIDRTTDVDALTGALAAGNLDSVIFPANPAAMVSLPDALDKLFPIKKDAHTVGIMAGVSWGRASLAQIDLGFFYDTAAPARIVAIGRLTVERPRVTLRLLALGVLDFDRGELDLQARLVESRILGVDLFGDAAIMLRWGQDPNFVLSIGGFHPDYHPPTEFTRRFPPLRRVTIRAHTDESVLRLAFQAYLAITSNTVQMGARVDFGVSVSALSVDGMVSFDALIQIDPALFINVTVRGSVALKVAGVTIIGAKVAAQLIGPGNWYAAGTATITVLWWDLDFGFETGGDRPVAPALPIIDGAVVLAASLANTGSWSALSTAQSRLISVRRPNAPGGALLFHPLDDLTVRQPVVPLGVVVTRMEEGRLAAPRTFEVTVKVGGTKMTTEAVWDAFARAKYMDMSDAAKLSTPSFEPMVSGARVVLDQAAAPAPSVNAGWSYDEFVWTANGLQSSTVRPFVPDATTVAHALATSATGQAPLRRSGVARYRGPLAGQVMLERGGGS